MTATADSFPRTTASTTPATRISLAAAGWPERTIALWSMAVLALAMLITRIPFATQVPFNWDSAQFMLAMRDYDVTRFQPHPPGYAAYVGLANGINWIVRDEHTSLLIISVLGSVLASWAVFFLAARLGGLLAGWIAGAMLVASVTYWAYGGVALTYVTLTFWCTAITALAYGVRYDKKPWLPVIAVLWGLACGFRGELVVFLAPVVLFATWGQPWRRILISLVLFGITSSIWFFPMIILSGGLAAYVDVFVQYIQRDVIQLYSVACERCLQEGFFGGPSGGLISNLYDVAVFNYYALGYGLTVLLVIAAIWWLTRSFFEERRTLIFALVAVVPMLLFYGFVHIGDQGYIFSTYGQLLVLTSVAMVALGNTLVRMGIPWGRLAIVGIVAIAIGVNLWQFLGRDTMVSRIGLARHDAMVISQIEYIRQTPADQRILLGADHYRHLVYYFPEQQTIDGPDPSIWWSDRFNPVGIAIPPKPIDRTLFVVDNDLIALVPAAGGEIVNLPTGTIGVVPVPAGTQVQYGANNGFIEVVRPGSS